MSGLRGMTAARWAAPGRWRTDITGRRDDALASLRYHWGEAYKCGFQVLARGVQFTAERRDGLGGVLRDPLAEGLRLRIAADYAARPVPRRPRTGTTRP